MIPEPPPDSALFVGRLEPDSGIRIYLEGLSRLAVEHGVKLTLDIIGDGSLAGELRARAAQARLPVIFHGKTQHAQDHFSRACFAFVDGRMAIQEAMARRRLVVAGYVDPLKRDYVCGESFSPYLVAVRNSAEFAERILYFRDHPAERAARVALAYAYTRTLTWRRTALAYLGLWTKRRVANQVNTCVWESAPRTSLKLPPAPAPAPTPLYNS